MSVWRRKAIECLPENRAEFQDPDTSVYTVFSALLPATVAAHRTGDDKRLRKYYAFAEWCSLQNAQDLWNAAGVSFYEHLADFPETLAAMPQWVNRSRYQQIRGLLQLRLTEKQLQQLDSEYY
ncbi:hypothetical protein [Chitinophaga filiformis]|uniref:DUF7674 domain-containing protein n=1 Tax=Chitinophaga filiformis TaxID=104663 RepID=A0ABY4IAM5_CHIFI|nr:hypothetical protein [Chitinophaga filiformis]UPK72703.1 hypothetical protein MYF79_15535 [Chitinophaga filiformis]